MNVLTDSGTPPVARPAPNLFKNSLRSWQSQWKARKAQQQPVEPKEPAFRDADDRPRRDE